MTHPQIPLYLTSLSAHLNTRNPFKSYTPKISINPTKLPNPIKLKPPHLIIILDQLNYQFPDTLLSTIFSKIIYGSSRSYIITHTNYSHYTQCITAIFKHFTPTQKQLSQLSSIYSPLSPLKSYLPYKILYDKGILPTHNIPLVLDLSTTTLSNINETFLRMKDEQNTWTIKYLLSLLSNYQITPSIIEDMLKYITFRNTLHKTPKATKFAIEFIKDHPYITATGIKNFIANSDHLRFIDILLNRYKGNKDELLNVLDGEMLLYVIVYYGLKVTEPILLKIFHDSPIFRLTIRYLIKTFCTYSPYPTQFLSFSPILYKIFTSTIYQKMEHVEIPPPPHSYSSYHYENRIHMMDIIKYYRIQVTIDTLNHGIALGDDILYHNLTKTIEPTPESLTIALTGSDKTVNKNIIKNLAIAHKLLPPLPSQNIPVNLEFGNNNDILKIYDNTHNLR